MVPNKQIGWSQEAILLQGVSRQLESLSTLIGKSSGVSGSGTVTSVGGTGTVSGLTLSGNVTTSGNLILSGTLVLSSSNITSGLGYIPVTSTRTVNGQALSSNVTLTQDNIADGTTYKQYSATDKGKVAAIDQSVSSAEKDTWNKSASKSPKAITVGRVDNTGFNDTPTPRVDVSDAYTTMDLVFSNTGTGTYEIYSPHGEFALNTVITFFPFDNITLKGLTVYIERQSANIIWISTFDSSGNLSDFYPSQPIKIEVY